MLPGPFGDWTRRKMDALGAEYDQAVLQLIREWNEKRDPTFAVVWCVSVPCRCCTLQAT